MLTQKAPEVCTKLDRSPQDPECSLTTPGTGMWLVSSQSTPPSFSRLPMTTACQISLLVRRSSVSAGVRRLNLTLIITEICAQETKS